MYILFNSGILSLQGPEPKIFGDYDNTTYENKFYISI
jgi:hypothetical protein